MAAHKRTPSQQYNRSSPGVRRILREAQEIASSPSRDFTAAPLDHDLFEWHFTLRGPPAPSPYDGGFYHGRIILSPNYPMRPPMFRFLTDSGRFEVNRDICLSISGFHEETWQPSWSIRLALIALRAHMDNEPEGQVGGLECTPETRRELARKSRDFKCSECGGGGEEEAMKIPEGSEGSTKAEDELPPDLRFGYKDQMKPKEDPEAEKKHESQNDSSSNPAPTPVSSTPAAAPQTGTSNVPAPNPPRRQDQQEPAVFIPYAAGQHQQVVHRQVGNRGVGVQPGNIPGPAVPTVATPVPAAAPRALANESDRDRTNSLIDLAIGGLFAILVYLIYRKL